MLSIVWFRQDLRLRDNPALTLAAKRGAVLPLYVMDDAGERLGGAARWWLHHSLTALTASLGGRLLLLGGDPRRLIREIAEQVGARAVFWNRCYEPEAIGRDKAIKASLAEHGIDAQSCNGALLHEPWEIETGSGGPFKVYTPFWRACASRRKAAPLPAPKLEITVPAGIGERLADWKLLPSKPNWAAGWDRLWTPGEEGALSRLESFVATGLDGYGERRNLPDLPNVSRLSPHLHWGELSPRQVWAKVALAAETGAVGRQDADKFLSEIGWREFAYHLLYHFPTLPYRNWRAAFDAYPWRDSEEDLAAWQRGLTGYPLVDAGMRELWRTGYMHNRVRMVVASFLVKHLRIDWRRGEAWFWDTLVDADLANNAAGWQWVAGSGADAAPYFRIFNPVEQSRKFDSEGAYVRRWCPELARLPNDHIHAPFAATADVLAAAGVTLGVTYPKPIVEHSAARRAALAAYEAVKAAHTAA